MSERRALIKSRSNLSASDRTQVALALNAHRDAHAATDTQRCEPLLGIAALHLVQERDENTGARRTDRMPDRDRAAVDVHDIRIPTHVLVDGTGLGGEGLIGFHEVEVV